MGLSSERFAWIERTCPECGKIFMPAPQHAYKDDRELFCSWHCINARHKRKEAERQAKIAKKTAESIKRSEEKRAERDLKKTKKTKALYTKPKYGYVLQFTIDGEFVASYRTTKEAALKVDTCGSNIARCARGETKQAAGYVWRYAAGRDGSDQRNSGKKMIRVLQLNVFEEVIAEYESMKAAAEATRINISSISKVVRGYAYQAGGYIWRAKEEEQKETRF